MITTPPIADAGLSRFGRLWAECTGSRATMANDEEAARRSDDQTGPECALGVLRLGLGSEEGQAVAGEIEAKEAKIAKWEFSNRYKSFC